MPAINITIRAATDAEAAKVLAIEQAAFEEYRDALDPPSGVFRETVDKVRQKMRDGTFLLALLHDDPVGSVFYQPESEHVYLGRLAVLPAYRRCGIGRALVEQVEAITLALGRSRVRLSARIALPHNHSYYERMGYRFVEERCHEGYTTPTYVVLQKSLTKDEGRTTDG